MNICLAMIVRDEADVIERCLDSVKDTITSWVIIDTGSIDNTKELIREKLRDIPGQLHEAAWVNFGHNRSELYKLVRKREAGAEGYMLLLDADMELQGTLDRAEITTDACMIQIVGNPTYRLPLLVNYELPWYSKGSTHEALTCDTSYTISDINSISLLHHCDGGHRTEKFDRDIELLRNEYNEASRTVFYLAQTEKDSNNTERAIELYLQRAKMGGFYEEVFYSLLQAGKLKNDIGLLFEAWASHPSRLEPLYEIAYRLRAKGQYQAVHKLLAPYLCDKVAEGLFVETWVWEWGVMFEYALAIHNDLGLAQAEPFYDILVAVPSLPPTYRESIQLNRSLVN